MKLAVAYQDGQIFQHFGHTQRFKIYEIENASVRSTEILDTAGTGHGALAGFLKALGADILICGGIGGGARMALEEAGIRLFGGVTGNADEAVNAFLNGNLIFDPNVKCNHHGDHSHGEGHTCGNHGCKSNS